ncbi:MAG: outer membrane protein assembly factor BamE [Thermoguttaceae bacterium]|jgi:outer membrane protein assembly factor BamE (lipoprotein component of BamABCDE complex)
MALLTIRSCEIKLWRVVVLFVCTSALMIFGLWLCGRLDEPRYLQLRTGMTLQQVREIMGDPDAAVRYDDREDWS